MHISFSFINIIQDPQFIRALSFVLERSTVTQYALRQNLNIDATTANAILQQMEERGVLQVNFYSRNYKR